MTSHIFAFHPGSTINESLAIQHPGNWCSKIFWFLQRNSAQISLQQRHCSEWKHQSRSQKLHSPCTIDKEVPWKLSKQKPMKSCTSIFGDPQKWPWDPVRPATCTPVSNGWLEVEKKHPGINSSNEICSGMTLKQLGLHCHTITATAPQEKRININIHVNDKFETWNCRTHPFLWRFHGRASRLCKWVSANFLTKHPEESTISRKSGKCGNAAVKPSMFVELKRMDFIVIPGHGWVEMLGIQPGDYQVKLLQRLISD